MSEWAIVKEHVVEDITLLCVQHHREKTNGLLSKKMVREKDKAPANTRGRSRAFHFHPHEASIAIIAGNNYFFFNALEGKSLKILTIDSMPVFWFDYEDGHLLLNLKIYNRSNHLVVLILKNELVFSTNAWDVQFVGRVLTIKATPDEVSLRLRIAPNEGQVHIEKAVLRYNGYEVFFRKDGIMMPASVNGFSGCIFTGAGPIMSYGGIAMAPLHLTGAKSYFLLAGTR